jgi:hypothetical protein
MSQCSDVNRSWQEANAVALTARERAGDNGGMPLSSKPRRTVGTFCCPACGEISRMLIVWPFWQCLSCDVRLIPADDLDPSPLRRQAVDRFAPLYVEREAPVWFI